MQANCLGMENAHILQEIIIEEQQAPKKAKRDTGLASPASVLHVPDMASDAWSSRASSRPSDESSSSSSAAPGVCSPQPHMNDERPQVVPAEYGRHCPFTDRMLCQIFARSNVKPLMMQRSVPWHD